MPKQDDDDKGISDSELLKALEDAEPLLKKSPKLHKLISLLIDRAIETSDKFNTHQHTVSVTLDGDGEYTSAGDGTASTPAKPGGYGCSSPIKIG